MKTINRKRDGDSVFVASFRMNVVYIAAVSLPSAKQKAIEYFAPKKKDRDLIVVEPFKEE